ncbi:MAG: hypothetical protein WCT99_08120, partial [Bacteroidota bacterium]
MLHSPRFVSWCCLTVCLWSAAPAQEKYFFYSGKDFGSESLYNPGSLIINGGFDILQSATHSRDL